MTWTRGERRTRRRRPVLDSSSGARTSDDPLHVSPVSAVGDRQPRLVLVAGASGSGKSRLAGRSGCCGVGLDHFYRDADAPGLPRVGGVIDWDDPATWDREAALAALICLLETGRAEIPDYDIAHSRVRGHGTLERSRPVVVAEGIFAPELLRPCLEAGLAVEGIWMDRPRALTFALRLARDLREHRKPVAELLARGVRLFRAEPALRASAVARGFVPLSMRRSTAHLTALADGIAP